MPHGERNGPRGARPIPVCLRRSVLGSVELDHERNNTPTWEVSDNPPARSVTTLDRTRGSLQTGGCTVGLVFCRSEAALVQPWFVVRTIDAAGLGLFLSECRGVKSCGQMASPSR